MFIYLDYRLGILMTNKEASYSLDHYSNFLKTFIIIRFIYDNDLDNKKIRKAK